MIIFSEIYDDEIYLYQGYLRDYTWKKKITDTNKTLSSNNFMKKTMEIYGWFFINNG